MTTELHLSAADLLEIDVVDISTSPEGYDYLELTGDVRMTTDNLVALASFFSGIGSLLTEHAVATYGKAAVLQELQAIIAGFPFTEPAPDPQLELPLDDEVAARLRHPSAPDIQGRDI